jgi:hypothetical protein
MFSEEVPVPIGFCRPHNRYNRHKPYRERADRISENHAHRMQALSCLGDSSSAWNMTIALDIRVVTVVLIQSIIRGAGAM